MLFGAHQSIAGGVANAVIRGQKATCDTIQMFNKSSNQWRAKELTQGDIDEFFRQIDETGVTVATSHTSYLINIASPDATLNAKSYDALKVEMERCERLKIPNLVMHPGSHVGTGEEPGMDRITAGINKLLAELEGDSVRLLLEATAGQGNHLGYTFEQLAHMTGLVEDKSRNGVCLDTCHIFAAGYAITDPKDYKKTMKNYDDTVGIENLHIIHANDSLRKFGTRKDRHEHLGKGHIGIEAFRNFVNDKRLKNVPMILETPKDDDLLDDIKNLKLLRSLVK